MRISTSSARYLRERDIGELERDAAVLTSAFMWSTPLTGSASLRTRAGGFSVPLGVRDTP